MATKGWTEQDLPGNKPKQAQKPPRTATVKRSMGEQGKELSEEGKSPINDIWASDAFEFCSDEGTHLKAYHRCSQKR